MSNLLNVKPMKKFILSAGALALSLGLHAQGWETAGAHDDFATATEYSLGANLQGIYWFDLTGQDTLVLSRPGTGAMNIAVTTAGGCNAASAPSDYGKCYPVFGANFGNDGAPSPTSYTVDLTGGANIKLDVENMHVSQVIFMSIILEDINGNKSMIEPNVSDVPVPGNWATDTQRKALNGFTVAAATRKTVNIDLSSVPGAIGGLTIGTYTCGGPGNCPTTSYTIDPSKIKTVMFQVNFGKDNIDLSEDLNYATETFISAGSIASYTGTVKFHDFKIGTTTTGIEEATINSSLKVYPNPAKEVLNISFDATSESNVVLSDIVGNAIYSTTYASGSNNISVNTSGLPTGMYILNISTENGRVARKVNIK
jgi:hypothetical protein